MPKKKYPMEEMDLRSLPGERWVDMRGFKNIYQVSSFGRIKAMERTIKRLNRWGQMNKSFKQGSIKQIKLVKRFNNYSGEYYYSCLVSLWKNNSEVKIAVGRVVYENFVGRLRDHEMITHKDGDGRNNRVNNLMAVDSSGLRKHIFSLGRQPVLADIVPRSKIKSIRRKLSETSKVPVQLIAASGRVIKNFASITEAAKDAPCDRGYLTHVLRGRKTHVKGKVYRYLPGFKLRK